MPEETENEKIGLMLGKYCGAGPRVDWAGLHIEIQKLLSDEREKMLAKPWEWVEIDNTQLTNVHSEWVDNISRSKHEDLPSFTEWANRPESLKRILRRKP